NQTPVHLLPLLRIASCALHRRALSHHRRPPLHDALPILSALHPGAADGRFRHRAGNRPGGRIEQRDLGPGSQGHHCPLRRVPVLRPRATRGPSRTSGPASPAPPTPATTSARRAAIPSLTAT